jgi:hypothetical protein
MGSIDRRFIYALIALAVLIPLLKPIGLPIAVSMETRNSYQVLTTVPDGSLVLIGFDYEPGSVAEMNPQAMAILRILAAKNVRVVGFTSFPVSGTFAETCLESTYGAAGKKYGVDYVNLGYYAGAEASLAAFCENPGSVFKADYRGNLLSGLPIMSQVKTVKDFALTMTLNDGVGTGSNTGMWVRQVNISHGQRLLLGVTAVSAASTVPYVNSKNAVGILVGLKAAAELEKASNMPGSAIASMDALTLGHVAIILLILLGNIAILASKYARRSVTAGVKPTGGAKQ